MSVVKRPNGKWRARYRDAAGREHARHFDRKVDADRWHASMKTALARGEWVDPALSRVTVGDWAARWFANQVQLKPSTRQRYGSLLRRQVLPVWERVALSAVTHADVGEWVRRMTQAGLAPSTVRQAHRVFSLLLALAVRDGRLTRNVASGVRLPRIGRAEKVFLSHGQVGELAAAAEPHGLIIRVLAYTGLRWGELAALRVRRVDLVKRRLLVAESVTEVNGRAVFGTPKTHQRRSVPLPRFLVEPIAAQIAGRSGDELVFTSPTGEVLRNNNFRRRVFDRAAVSVGLAGLTPHELRHTAASLAVAEGANVKAVQRMLGHASAAMTLDVYADLFEDDLDQVADRLDRAAGRAAADSVRTVSLGPDLDAVRLGRPQHG
ncbi:MULTISPECIES: site-specific integrase [Micromonospora]|uniref:tyrosine-type recombinase/integrase n=1 Tax=Micromonospora TaxID=1873 RepID=UPI0009EE3E90|nr:MULTISPECIES: site-specific integrase [unclassified Micromonospora]MBQ1065177.1 site-specific integrase [Micromonospora sp. C41]